jgi:hypothetical protein
MKAAIFLVVLWSCIPQPIQNQKVPEQTNESNQDAKRQPIPATPADSSTAPHQQKPADNEHFAKRHGWNYYDAIAPPTWSNWTLVLVGIAATFAALLTLGGIRQQAEIMQRQTRAIRRQALSMRRQTTLLRKSADAAKLSADALINSETSLR